MTDLECVETMTDSNQEGLSIQTAQSRKACYGFLSSALLHRPTEQMVEQVGDAELHAALDSLFDSGVTAAFRELAQPKESADSQIGAIRQDYEDLFNVPGAKYVAPYEAVFRDERDVGAKKVRGLLFGPSTDDVIRFYHVAGLEVSPEFLELPDHIGLEFHFMAYLIEKELGALASGDMALVDKIRETQQGFLAHHLAQWVGGFASKMEEQASTPFYRGIALLAREFVAHDFAGLCPVRR